MNLEESYYLWSIPVFIILLGIKYIVSKTIAALENLSETERKEHLEEDSKMQMAEKVIMELEENSNLLLGILTTINVIMGMIYGRLFFGISKKYLSVFPVNENGAFVYGLVEIVWIVIITYIIVLFGNILPRKLGLKNSKRIVKGNIVFLHYFFRIWKPFSSLIKAGMNFVLWCMHIKPEDVEANLTEDEIISVVNEGLEQGVLENNEVKMISNIIEFDEKEVKDIMTHRKKIIALDSSMIVEDALKFILETTYSRFPVYEEDIDNIIGILYLKDITKYYVTHQKAEEKQIAIKELIKPPYLVPDIQGIDTLFQDMQLKNIHMAIAIDEYGQTAGVVAMEDILEEIVGNISDEFDVEEKMIIKQTDHRYFVKGLAPLKEVEEALGIDMEEEQEDYDTLNGLLISLIGHIPEEQERITVEYKGYLFRVLRVKNKMIQYVRVTCRD